MASFSSKSLSAVNHERDQWSSSDEYPLPEDMTVSAADSTPDLSVLNIRTHEFPKNGPATSSELNLLHPQSKSLHATILTPGNTHHTHFDTYHASPVRDPSPMAPKYKKGLPSGGLAIDEDDGKKHILVAATGSVASVKIPLIVKSLLACEKVEVQVIITKAAKHFFDVDLLRTGMGVKVWEDEDEWSYWHELSDPVLHIELRRWAHLLIITPCSANTLAKIANGLCDNLLTSVLRAWNPSIPIFLAPAMNTQMYTHPITAYHIKLIKEHLRYIEIINPIEKVLACKDIGMGGMAEWGDIVGRVYRKLGIKMKDDDGPCRETNGEQSFEESLEDAKVDEEVRSGGEYTDEEDEGIRTGGDDDEKSNV